MEEIKNQFFLESKALIKKIIKEKQNEINSETYEIKNPNDKIICIICNGKYTRGAKNVHDKTKKHISELNKLYKYIFNY
jgi:hypothetical protein